jgi:RimJ/RimL family protein N-acetyltransferase
MIHHCYWNRGYATEAVRMFLNVFWELRPEVNLLEAHVDDENAASLRIVEKFGFVKDGVLSGEGKGGMWLAQRGEWRSMGVWKLSRPVKE